LTPLLVALALSGAPGCPAALARGRSLSDPDLAGDAPAVVRALRVAGAGGPSAALDEEAARAKLASLGERTEAGARFRAALARHCTLAGEPALPFATPADRATAAAILDRPAFRRARADPEALHRWLLSVWQRFLDLLQSEQAQRYAAVSRAIFFGAAATAALIAGLALLVRRPHRPPPPRPRTPATSPAADPGLGPAQAAAENGQGSLSVRLAMLAALSALERDGTVPRGRTLTNAELVGQLTDVGPERLGAAKTLATLFDRAVYGGRPVAPPEAQAALAAARVLGAVSAP